MEVRRESFTYSAFPGRWGTPLSGVAVIGVFLSAGHVGNDGSAPLALAILVFGLAAIGVAGWWLARYGVLSLPLARREGVNLTAVRTVAGRIPDDTAWFMAHLDSKSQPLPIAVRAAGIVATGAVALLAVTYAAAQWVGAADGSLWLAVTGIGVLAAIPVAASTVADRSPGALDNATGVTGVLLAAAALPTEAPCAVCITSAEELGLAGARAWIAGRRDQKPQTVWNVDTLDDSGTLQAMWSHRLPHSALAQLSAAARANGQELRIRRVLPGILTDGIAVADAGWPAITLSRGTLRTLLRIHRPNDTARHLTGEGAAVVATLMARAAGSTDTTGAGTT